MKKKDYYKHMVLYLSISLVFSIATSVIVLFFGNPPLTNGWYVHNIPEIPALFFLGAFFGSFFHLLGARARSIVLFWCVSYPVLILLASLVFGFDRVIFIVILLLPFVIGACFGGHREK